MTEDILQEILVQDSNGELFYRFANADGKIWIMPARNLRTAMELYQPSGWKGRLLKRWFPILHRLRIVRSVVHAEGIRCRMNGELRKMLERVLDTEDVEFSIFCGTPCVHQKITMQLSKGDKILGYCKLTENDEIAALFEKEAHLLEALHGKGMWGVPECLLYGKMDDGARLFVQSTEKTTASRVMHDWSDMHDKFLTRLKEATARQLRFEQSDYFHTLKTLEEHIDWLPDGVDKGLVERTLREIFHRWQGKEVTFSAYHADFTPWNMFVEDDRLYVFDWEYAQMTYPPMLDRYHFFTQTAIFERHWKAENILRYMISKEGRWMDAEDYKAYLIEVIARFTIRERGRVKGNLAFSMKLWSDLLLYLSPNSTIEGCSIN